MRTSSEELRLRASAVVVRERHILVSRWLEDPFYALPGGRVRPGEMSSSALRRELHEELGAVRPAIGRLMFVIENRFAYARRRFHEVGFSYRVDLDEGCYPLRSDEFAGAETHLLLRWIDLDELTRIDLRPRPLRDRLAELPDTLEHLEIDELSGPAPEADL